MIASTPESLDTPSIDGAPLRADAQRNLVRVLESAGELFAEEGVGVSMDVIAKRAGVGVGTIYRRFPTKAALAEAVVLHHLNGLYDEVVAIGAATPDDEVVPVAITRIVEVATSRLDLKEALCNIGVDVHVIGAPFFAKLHAAVGVMVERGQRAGAIRPDVTADDVVGLISAACMANSDDLGISPVRLVTLIADGLRTERAPVRQ